MDKNPPRALDVCILNLIAKHFEISYKQPLKHSPRSSSCHWFGCGCWLYSCRWPPPQSQQSLGCRRWRPWTPLLRRPNFPTGSLSRRAGIGPNCRRLPQSSLWVFASLTVGQNNLEKLIWWCDGHHQIMMKMLLYLKNLSALFGCPSFIFSWKTKSQTKHVSTYSNFTSGALVSSYYFDALRLLPVELHEPHFKLHLWFKTRQMCMNVKIQSDVAAFQNHFAFVSQTFMSLITSGTGATSWCLEQKGLNYYFISVAKEMSHYLRWDQMFAVHYVELDVSNIIIFNLKKKRLEHVNQHLRVKVSTAKLA